MKCTIFKASIGEIRARYFVFYELSCVVITSLIYSWWLPNFEHFIQIQRFFTLYSLMAVHVTIGYVYLVCHLGFVSVFVRGRIKKNNETSPKDLGSSTVITQIDPLRNQNKNRHICGEVSFQDIQVQKPKKNLKKVSSKQILVFGYLISLCFTHIFSFLHLRIFKAKQ